MVADVLKRFALKITTPSVKERIRICESVAACVPAEEFTDVAVRGVARLLILTLSRYRDRKSRRAVHNVVVQLASLRAQPSSQALVSVLAEFAAQQVKLSPCVSTSSESLAALSWLCTVCSLCYHSSDDMKQAEFTRLVDVQCALVHSIMAAQKPALSRSCQHKLEIIWRSKEDSILAYVDAMTATEMTVEKFVMLCCLVKFLTKQKHYSHVLRLKETFLEAYVRLVFGGRSAMKPHVVKSCSELLRHVTHDEFQSQLLPVLDRALLRNPETAIICVRDLLSSVNIDLSSYSTELGRHLAAQCRSNDESVHAVASEAVHNLAKQCSDPSAIESLAKHFFAVVNGAEGKLAGLPQKLCLLTAIANLAHNSVSGTSSIELLASAVIDMFISLLQSESGSHELTVIHEVNAMSRWCNKFTASTPTKLVSCFRTQLSAKSSTSAVRTVYVNCMTTTFNGDMLIEGMELIPLLIQMLDKAASQPTQVQQVTEAAAVANLIAKLLVADHTIPESKLMSFWSLVTDVDKQIFANDKFLSQASDDALLTLASLSECLLTSHTSQLKERQLQMYYKILLHCLSHKSHSVRSAAQGRVRKMISSLGGAQMSLAFINELRCVLATIKESCPFSDEEGQLLSRIMANVFRTVTAVPSAEASEAELIAMETLFDAHHPVIVSDCSDAWTDSVALLHVDAALLVNKHAQRIIGDLFKLSSLSQTQQNTVSTMSRVAGDSVTSLVVSHVIGILADSSLATVTRDEFALLSWPEGQLYDKSVIDSTGTDAESKASNVRRENKLYSYKEQMAEIELRAELEKKRKAAGKDEVKLTKKQQEAVAAQLAKESVKRNALLQLDDRLSVACSLLMSCLRGNAGAVRRQLPSLIPEITSLMSSALAAPRLTELFVALGNAAFESRDRYVGHLVAHCTLRLLNPECHLSSDWLMESLHLQSSRAVSLLYADSIKSSSMQPELEQSTEPGASGLLSAPAVAYCFPLLRAVVMSRKKSEQDEPLLVKCLDLLSVHATRLRSDNPQDEFSPSLLPRELMLRLSSDVVATTTGRIQQHAAAVIVETARCASGSLSATAESDDDELPGCISSGNDGEPGRTMAGLGEVNILLDGLQSSSVALREVCIQVSSTNNTLLSTYFL